MQIMFNKNTMKACTTQTILRKTMHKGKKNKEKHPCNHVQQKNIEEARMCKKHTKESSKRAYMQKKEKSCSIKTLREHAPKTTHKAQREAWHTTKTCHCTQPWSAT